MRLWCVSFVLVLAAAVSGDAEAQSRRAGWFPDRPVAWHEHDDQHVAQKPSSTPLGEWDFALLIRDSLAKEVDRVLSVEGPQPARDVNALDEVPCSTWFCPRHHLRPLHLEALTRGPSAPAAPRLPLTIVRGKHQGATPGFEVEDAGGDKFLLKLDPAGHLAMSTGAEKIGQLVFHAAGYNVPGAFVRDLDQKRDLLLSPRATYKLYGVDSRPLRPAHVQAQLDAAAHTPQGKLRVVLVPWIPGEILGGFDMEGRKRDDPNDRIAHEDRRSLRASFVLAAWLSVLDPSSVNTLDTLVEENGRRFVRHYFIDFGAALGSATNHPAGLADGGQHLIEVGRTIKAFFGLGFYRRPFQLDKDVWRQAVQRYPNVGWFPAERFDPDDYHPNRKNPAHVRATDRDLYWGAKLVTAFTDAQIAALVDQARFPRPEADYVLHALRVRRDIIGRRYLGPMTAVERPAMAAGDAEVCFSDLGVDRGLARPDAIRYAITISDGLGQRLSSFEQQAGRARTCVPVGPGPGTSGYRIVEVERLGNQAKAARIHLRWRSPERRFVVVGLERDE